MPKKYKNRLPKKYKNRLKKNYNKFYVVEKREVTIIFICIKYK